MKVHVTFTEVDLETDSGQMIESVSATCTRCDHSVDSYGTSGASRRRCLAVLRETCLNGENNFYVDADA